jgi:hypothetical protein
VEAILSHSLDSLDFPGHVSKSNRSTAISALKLGFQKKNLTIGEVVKFIEAFPFEWYKGIERLGPTLAGHIESALLTAGLIDPNYCKHIDENTLVTFPKPHTENHSYQEPKVNVPNLKHMKLEITTSGEPTPASGPGAHGKWDEIWRFMESLEIDPETNVSKWIALHGFEDKKYAHRMASTFNGSSDKRHFKCQTAVRPEEKDPEKWVLWLRKHPK